MSTKSWMPLDVPPLPSEGKPEGAAGARLLAELQQTREHCRKAKHQWEALEAKFKRAEEFCLRAELVFARCRQELQEHIPLADTDFPTEEETAAWEREHAARTKELHEAREEYANSKVTRDQLRVEALQVASNYERLLWHQKSVKNMLDGPPEGGINFVR